MNKLTKKSAKTNQTSELRQKLRTELVKAHPEIEKDYLYNRCVNNYCEVVLRGFMQVLANNIKDDTMAGDEFAFSQQSAALEAGRIGKPQRYVYHLMQQSPATSLLLEVRKGFNKGGVSKLSVMTLNPVYEDLMIEELLNLRLVKNQQLLDEIERTANYAVRVDLESLRGFINKCQDTIRTTNKGRAYKAKLVKNLAAARQLLTMAHPPDASHPTSAYVLERWEQKDSGRIYGQGYSLQRMPKEVRHAALGVCHKYDFNACAFALMAGLAHQIDPTLKIGAVLDYIKGREKIRLRIANELGIAVDVVKTIFTSLGFGAEVKNNCHSAIRGTLSKAARQHHDRSVWLDAEVWNNLGENEFQRLLGNQTFAFIYEDLKRINATSLNAFDSDDLEINGFAYTATDSKTGKKRNKRQKLAWIYQALEFQAMIKFADLARQEPLLTTHDCIYFKEKLSTNQVLDITLALQQVFPYLRFEHKKIYPIADSQQFDRRFAEQLEFEREHAARMAKEELAAKGYKSKYFEQIDLTGTEYARIEWEKNAWRQFARDAGLTEHSAAACANEKEIWG